MKKVILGLVTGMATVQILIASLMITRMTRFEIGLTIISLIWMILFIAVNDNKMKLKRR